MQATSTRGSPGSAYSSACRVLWSVSRSCTLEGCMSLHFSTISAARACRSVRSLKLLTVILQHQVGSNTRGHKFAGPGVLQGRDVCLGHDECGAATVGSSAGQLLPSIHTGLSANAGNYAAGRKLDLRRELHDNTGTAAPLRCQGPQHQEPCSCKHSLAPCCAAQC
jgi:hypothetical protein